MPRAASRSPNADPADGPPEPGAASGEGSSPARGSGTSPGPGPPARSASSDLTVCAASDLLVPITPVGPRLSQPATYSPSSGAPSGPSTRPSAFGTIEARSSNGPPGSGPLW